jgi:hypothetical protein
LDVGVEDAGRRREDEEKNGDGENDDVEEDEREDLEGRRGKMGEYLPKSSYVFSQFPHSVAQQSNQTNASLSNFAGDDDTDEKRKFEEMIGKLEIKK